MSDSTHTIRVKASIDCTLFRELGEKLINLADEMEAKAMDAASGTTTPAAAPPPPTGAQPDLPTAPPPEPPAAASPDTATGDGTGEALPELDANGVPWDERIHSSSHKKTANGVWARRRNTPDETFDAVMNELKGGAPATGPDDAVAPPAGTGQPDAPAPPPPGGQATAPPPPTGEAPVPAVVCTFEQLAENVTAQVNAGYMTDAQADAIAQKYGATNLLGMVTAPPGSIANAWDDVQAQCRANIQG